MELNDKTQLENYAIETLTETHRWSGVEPLSATMMAFDDVETLGPEWVSFFLEIAFNNLGD